MRYTLGAEEIEPGRWIGWVFEYPGCVTYGTTKDEVIARAPEQIAAFQAWLNQQGEGLGPLFASEAIDVILAEIVQFEAGEQSLENSRAFFESDKVPLKSEDGEQALRILNQTRNELIRLIQDIPPSQLNAPIDGEMRGSIADVLEHMAWAEWWYCDRLSMAFNREEMPEDPRAKLYQVRSWTRARIRELVGQKKVVEQLGERWSPRKLIRRAVWHEIDHIAHIGELLNGQVNPNGRFVEL
jgi:hypothetical protein